MMFDAGNGRVIEPAAETTVGGMGTPSARPVTVSPASCRRPVTVVTGCVMVHEPAGVMVGGTRTEPLERVISDAEFTVIERPQSPNSVMGVHASPAAGEPMVFGVPVLT